MNPLDVTSELLAQSGHQASRSTLHRWIRDNDLRTVRQDGVLYVSFSDVLQVHRRMIERR
ncbi:hypothetical protein [Streptomyces sp. NPDC059076]|uniref:hypothetical protein n=1 Tax=unclassified Streptomyces TaxID=2593676 RepID=UPI003685A13E